MSWRGPRRASGYQARHIAWTANCYDVAISVIAVISPLAGGADPCPDNFQERVGVQSGSPDEGAVDAVPAKHRGGVLRLRGN